MRPWSFSPRVEYAVEDQVGVITLNRPEAANAQSAQVLDELDWAWREADRDPGVKVIVLTSNGKHFSAGHDMSSTKSGDLSDTEIDELILHVAHYGGWPQAAIASQVVRQLRAERI